MVAKNWRGSKWGKAFFFIFLLAFSTVIPAKNNANNMRGFCCVDNHLLVQDLNKGFCFVGERGKRKRFSKMNSHLTWPSPKKKAKWMVQTSLGGG